MGLAEDLAVALADDLCGVDRVEEEEDLELSMTVEIKDILRGGRSQRGHSYRRTLGKKRSERRMHSLEYSDRSLMKGTDKVLHNKAFSSLCFGCQGDSSGTLKI